MYYYLTPDSFHMLLNPQYFVSKGQLLYALVIDVPKECGLPDVYKTCYLNSWALSLIWFTIDIVSSSCCFNCKSPFPSALSFDAQSFASSCKAPLTSSIAIYSKGQTLSLL